MAKADRIRKKIDTQLIVGANRLSRRMRRLSDDEVLSLYEVGSNMFFHGPSLDDRAYGGVVLQAAVHTLCSRYEAVKKLDLTKPFPLRDWMRGDPQQRSARSRTPT